MSTQLEVIFAPAEFAALSQRDLSSTTCVVFDILRATSTMITALAHGAHEIIPVAEISEALQFKAERPDVLLAGERNGLLIGPELTGGAPFDLGNSPREFVAEQVKGRTLVMTTTNGTRALRSCTGARSVLIGTFLGLEALATWIRSRQPSLLLLVCSGTIDQISYEDVLGTGALCELMWSDYSSGSASDTAYMARQLYRRNATDLFEAMQFARNGRRLLDMPELRDDVPFCLQRDRFDFVAGLDENGSVRRILT